MKTLILAVAFFVLTLGALPDGADAQYHGVTHHRLSRRAARARHAGWNQGGGQQQGVPELDPTAAGAALFLLFGGFVVLRHQRRDAAHPAI